MFLHSVDKRYKIADKRFMHYFGVPCQLAKTVPSPLLVQGISACTMLVQNYFTQKACQPDFALYWCKSMFPFWKLTKMVHFYFTQKACQLPFWCILIIDDNSCTKMVHFWVFPKRKRTILVRPPEDALLWCSERSEMHHNRALRWRCEPKWCSSGGGGGVT